MAAAPPAEGAGPLAGAAWLGAPETRALLAALGGDGALSRFVGGCVRDTLLDPALDGVDLDVATQARPEATLARLRAAGIRTVPTGLAHGTVTARLGDRAYEITTLRRDVATDGRHAVVAFTDDFEADAARRDFTINAMSCDPDGHLYDYFGGRDDLAAGRVRFVGEPARRVEEDYLRVLRFFRFFARFGREPADPAAVEACRAGRGGLSRLAGERVWGELRRLLLAPGAAAAIRLTGRTGVWEAIFGVPPNVGMFERLIDVDPRSSAVTRLSALLRNHISVEAGVTRFARHVAEQLKLSSKERADLVLLIVPDSAAGDVSLELLLRPSDVRSSEDLRRFVYQEGWPRARAKFALACAERGATRGSFDALWGSIADWTEPVFPMTGDDLRERGVAPGPAFGRLLDRVRDEWVRRDFRPDRAACLAHLDRLLAEGPPAPSP